MPSAFVASWEDQACQVCRWNFQLLLRLHQKVRLWGYNPGRHTLCSGIYHPFWYPVVQFLGSGVCFFFWFDGACALDLYAFPQVLHVREFGDHLVFLCAEIDVHVRLRQVGIVLGTVIQGWLSGDTNFRKSLLE